MKKLKQLEKFFKHPKNLVKSLARNAKASFCEILFDKSEDENNQMFYSYIKRIRRPYEDLTGSHNLTIEVEQLNGFFL